MPEDLRVHPHDIKEIAAQINQELLAACQAALGCFHNEQPVDESIKSQLQNAILKSKVVIDYDLAIDLFERYIVVGEIMTKINDEAVYDLLRGIVTAICLTMTETEASELIEQINAQEIVTQYGHIVEYGKVVRARSEADSGPEPPESGQDSAMSHQN